MGGKHDASARSGTARAAPARRRLHLRHLDFETRAIVCQSARFELVAMAFWDLPVGHGHPARISAPGGERIPLTNLVGFVFVRDTGWLLAWSFVSSWFCVRMLCSIDKACCKLAGPGF